MPPPEPDTTAPARRDAPIRPDGDPDGDPPERIGPWELRRRIGRGGTSDVWLAVRVDGSYRRRVAIKKLHPANSSKEALERFERERQTLASLAHPGISKLLEAGAARDGTPFIVLELVDGQPIDRFADERRLGVRARVELVVQIADALAAAHAVRIVHRDLKPSNVLVDLEGRPTLIDFGSGDAFLTPSYASPEQLRGEPLNAASDVYSLAALTYELLCGSPPLDLAGRGAGEAIHIAGERSPRSMAAALRQHPGANEVARLRAHDSAAGLARDLRDRSLGAVVLAGLRKDPTRRPPDAGAFRDELVRWLGGRAVHAAPDGSLHGLKRMMLRHRLSSFLAVTLLGAVAVSAARTWSDARLLRRANAELSTQAEAAQSRTVALRESVTALLQETIVTLGGIPGAREAVTELTRTGMRLAEAQGDPQLSIPLGLTIVRDMQREIDWNGGSNDALERGLRGISIAEAAALELGLDARPRLAQARFLMCYALNAMGRFYDARAQANRAAEDVAAMPSETLSQAGRRAVGRARAEEARCRVAQSTGQFAEANGYARAGLEIIERARRERPALAILSMAPSRALESVDPIAASQFRVAREMLLNVEASLVSSLAEMGEPVEALDVSGRVVELHGPNEALGIHRLNRLLAAAQSELDRDQPNDAKRLLEEAASLLSRLPEGDAARAPGIKARAGLAAACAQRALEDDPGAERDAELDRLSGELSDLSVRLELDLGASFDQRRALARLLERAGEVEAARGRMMEATSRLSRAYSLYRENVAAAPASLGAATGQCRLAAQLAKLLRDASATGDAAVWRTRARQHYDSIQWDDAARAQFAELYAQAYGED